MTDQPPEQWPGLYGIYYADGTTPSYRDPGAGEPVSADARQPAQERDGGHRRTRGAPGERPRLATRIRLIAYRPEEDGFLVIDIIDNGIGIEPSRFRSVFNAGYTTKKNGSGLGPHSAANFVIGSGGKIQPLSDGIGRGTTIRVRLRLAAPSLPADRAGTERAARWRETGGQPDPAELS